MNGKAVYEKATTAVPECIQQILSINRLGLEDVSMIVPHQATARVLKRIAEVLNVPFPDFRQIWSCTGTPLEPQFRCS
jgi:3-oxoacyl-[acyl-carrier-protein] synthase-3